MAVTTTASRRPVLSIVPRGVTLDDWEAKAPLREDELQSVSQTKDRCSERKLPAKYTATAASTAPATPSRPSTPVARRQGPGGNSLLQSILSPSSARSAMPSRPSTPQPLAASTVSSTAATLSISTPQQFYDWFSTLTSSLEHEQDALYRDHLAEIASYREACDRLVGECQAAEGVCEEMAEAFRFVEERSKSLQLACEELLEEQNRLLETSDALAHRLAFFSSLEPAIRTLNSPGEALVTGENFVSMVERIDECLQYLKSHRDFRDSELYIIRYQQCLTRSMTLVKMHFVTQIKLLGAEISRKMADRNLSDTALQALLYTKVAALATQLRPLLHELEIRSGGSNGLDHQYRTRDPSSDDLSSLLGECHAVWVGMRQSVLGAVVASEVMRLNPAKGDIVELTRAGCGYLKQLCTDEDNLFRLFFATGENRLHSFLETMCDYLFDNLRPRILHEGSLTTLCQVCTVVQALMVLDTTDDDESDTNDDDAIVTSLVMANHQPDHQRRKVHLSGLLQPVLQDAQTRLVFRAQAIIQTSIGRYAPKDADLDYPSKLGVVSGNKKQSPTSETTSKPVSMVSSTVDLKSAPSMDGVEGEDDEDDAAGLFRLPSLEVQETWYPSVRKTLWVLNELHSFIDPVIFQDIAQDAVALCRQSLLAASDLVGLRATKIDGSLFLVRHLLILKEMMASVELIERDIVGRDMLGLTEAFSALLASALSFLPNALTFGYGTTSVIPRGAIHGGTSSHDSSRADLDRALKSACEGLIALVSVSSTTPARAFVTRASAFLANNPSVPPASTAGAQQQQPQLTDQPWATPEQVLAVHAEVWERVRTEVREWVKKLRIYLEDEKAVEVLIPPMQSSIVDAYRPFHDLARTEYDFSVSSVVASPIKMWEFLREIVAQEERERER